MLLDNVGGRLGSGVLPLNLVGFDRVEKLVVVVVLLLVVEAELAKQALAEGLLIDDVVVGLAGEAVLQVDALRDVRKVHQLSPFFAAAFVFAAFA